MPGRRLVRRTRLSRGVPLSRRTSLQRRQMRTFRAVMSPAERHGKDVVAARSGGLCEACGMRRVADVHHRKNRSQGGTWDPANLLGLCRTCHDWIGGNRAVARARGWAVFRGDDPALTAVLRRGSWVVLGGDGAVTPILNYPGADWGQCESEVARPTGGGLRCALGVLHDGDHECGLVRWPHTSEERASV